MFPGGVRWNDQDVGGGVAVGLNGPTLLDRGKRGDEEEQEQMTQDDVQLVEAGDEAWQTPRQAPRGD